MRNPLIKFSIKTRRWLSIGFYKPSSQNKNYFLDNLSLVINKLPCQYKNSLLIGDFNMTTESKKLEAFMNLFHLECLINADVSSLIKQHEIACAMQISRKPTYIISCVNQFLKRKSENKKIVHGKTFIPTNNYDLTYLKQRKSNLSLSLLSYSNFCK